MVEELFLAGRILYGGYFFMASMNHLTRISMMTQYAASKNVPAPKLAVIVSGLLIFFGGLGILFGVLVQQSVWLLVVFLAVVSPIMHNFWAVQDPMQKEIERVNFLKNMALLGAALMSLAVFEPWPYSLLL